MPNPAKETTHRWKSPQDAEDCALFKVRRKGSTKNAQIEGSIANVFGKWCAYHDNPTNVRVGIYATRAEAEQAVLKACGFVK